MRLSHKELSLRVTRNKLKSKSFFQKQIFNKNMTKEQAHVRTLSERLKHHTPKSSIITGRHMTGTILMRRTQLQSRLAVLLL
jgi:hypothetical protein